MKIKAASEKDKAEKDGYTYPKGEKVWVAYYGSSGNLLFIITAKEARDAYYLYELRGSEFVKLGKAREPPALIEKYKVMERMRDG